MQILNIHEFVTTIHSGKDDELGKICLIVKDNIELDMHKQDLHFFLLFLLLFFCPMGMKIEL